MSALLASLCTRLLKMQLLTNGAVLPAFKADPHIVAAAPYDKSGKSFAAYPDTLPSSAFAATVQATGYRFERTNVVGFTSVSEADRQCRTSMAARWRMPSSACRRHAHHFSDQLGAAHAQPR